MKRVTHMVLAALAAVSLAGCDGGEHSDLQRELAELTKDAKGKVDPLPAVQTYEPVAYAAFDSPDPFGPAKIKLLNPQTASAGSGNAGPDLTRPKEPLEAFPLESLRMVGTLQRARNTWALVRADQGVFRVRVGNYLGQNFGVITKISDNEISLKELIQDGTGDWSERVSSLLLQEAEARK
jgi:type IV pilus assembly protein PilP